MKQTINFNKALYFKLEQFFIFANIRRNFKMHINNVIKCSLNLESLKISTNYISPNRP